MTAKRTDINIEELNKLYLEGKTINELAKHFRCGFNTVLRKITVKRPPIIRKDGYDWNHRMDMELKRLDSLSTKDKQIILDFLEECKSERLSKVRILHYSSELRNSKRWRNKDLVDMQKDDVKKMLNQIEDEDFAEWTKQNYRIAFKKFFRWYAVEKLGQKLREKEYPETVDWINTTIKAHKKKRPEDVLDEQDVKKMIDIADNPRDKALISLLWDSGCRIGEVLNLKLKHLHFDRFGGYVEVSGKTGSRKVRLVPSIPYLATLKENHPDKNNNEAYLFVGNGSRNKGVRLGYNAIDSLMRKFKEKSGVKKKVHAHAFRHGRASNLASKIKEPVLKDLFGWTQKSQMAAVYVHLSERDIRDEKLRADGVDIPEDVTESKLKPIICPRCSTMNAAGASFCQKCSMILDEQLAKKAEHKEAVAAQVFNKIQTTKMEGSLRDVAKEVIKDMIKTGELKV